MQNYIFKLLIVAFTVTLISCGGAEERKVAYLEKATTSYENENYEKARVDLKNVLQIDPKYAPAYFMLGKIHERDKEFRKSFANYNKAAELDPENIEYKSMLGKYYLLLARDIEKAKEILRAIQIQDKSNVDGLLLEAAIYMKEDKTEDAISIARSIIDANPNHEEGVSFLASVYMRQKLYKEAIKVLDKAMLNAPKSSKYKVLLADNLLRMESYDRAEIVLREILDLSPEVFANHVRLAMLYKKVNKENQAEKVLRDAIEADESNFRRKLVYIEYLQQTRSKQDALAELENMVKSHPDEGELKLALAKFHQHLADIDKAISVYKMAIADHSEESVGIKARIALAQIYMTVNKRTEADNIIEDAIAIVPNDADAHLIKAKIDLSNKKIESAIISLRTVVKEKPDHVQGYVLLSEAHNRNGENEQAKEILKRAYDNVRVNPNSLLELAEYYIKTKNTSEAIRLVDEALKISSNNYTALAYKARLLNIERKYVEAGEIATKMITLDETKPGGYLQSIPSLVAKKKENEAMALLEQGYEKTKHDQGIFEVIIAARIGKKEHGAAIKLINNSIEDGKYLDKKYMLLAKTYVAKNDLNQARNHIKTAITNNPSWDQPYIELAKLEILQNSIEDAEKTLLKGLLAIPHSEKIMFLLANIYENRGMMEHAIHQYENLLEFNKNNLLATNNLVALLSEHRTDDESLKTAVILSDKLVDIDKPVVQDTVAWAYYKTKKYDEALVIMKKVIGSAPDVSVFNYHIGMIFHKLGDNVSAKKHLSVAVKSEDKYTGKSEAEKTLSSI